MVDEDPIQNMINDAFGVDKHHANEVPIASNEESGRDDGVTPNVTQARHEAEEFYELARDGEQPLYEGCTKYLKLSLMVKFYHIKCLCGMSDKAMTMILELLQNAFGHAKIPSSFYEGNKEDEERETCRVCNTSKWKSRTKSGETEASNDDNRRKKVPAKVLRYFPLKPRQQILFVIKNC